MLTCDRCGAKAFWIFNGPSGVLLFCGHHAALHTPSLQEQGFNRAILAESYRVEAFA